VPIPRGNAPVVFAETPFAVDTERASQAATQVGRDARRQYEHDGIPVTMLRRCEAEGNDGTQLSGCLKIYLPPPAGKFGMVFRLTQINGRLVLAYLAFGVRHHPPDSHADTVYKTAHRRLHG
jgi:hypothetical protein